MPSRPIPEQTPKQAPVAGARGKLVVSPAASQHDLEVAAEILDEAASWLSGMGVQSWPLGSFHTPGTFEHEALQSGYRSGDLYLALEDGQAVATISLLWEDPLHWPAAPPD